VTVCAVCRYGTEASKLLLELSNFYAMCGERWWEWYRPCSERSQDDRYVYGTVEVRVVRKALTKVSRTWDMVHALMRYTMVKTMSSTHLSVRMRVPHSESERYMGIALYS
jgi:hypothetical protein